MSGVHSYGSARSSIRSTQLTRFASRSVISPSARERISSARSCASRSLAAFASSSAAFSLADCLPFFFPPSASSGAGDSARAASSTTIASPSAAARNAAFSSSASGGLSSACSV
eukprot:1427792-Prymnesium_polylepis.2